MPSVENLDLSKSVNPCQESLTDGDSLTPEAFKQLLSQYKRAGYESIQVWYQSQSNLHQDASSNDKDQYRNQR